MNSLMPIFALVEMSITCALVIIWLLQKSSPQDFPLALKVILLLILGNLFFWPLGFSLELPLAAYVRGMVGDLSVVTTLLLWSAVLINAKPVPTVFKTFIVIIAIIFYPLALGVGMADPYAWGYASLPFFIAVLLVALICGLANWSRGVWIIAVAIIAWAAHWHESANLWDYLLDPLLAIWAVATIIAVIHKNRKDKARSGYLFRAG
ncbi:hypothetical protein [Polynucleobacter asymbioticus]|jgi:hypothetical protein|uniref:hypothetical protein n=1 Tax=Polynucleobacter asymbioticus TaxID=576611 RepID=UPI0008F873E7|nr:hypothetical protein [Polynucleobacter asymbioticus]